MVKRTMILAVTVSAGLMAVGCGGKQAPGAGDMDARLAAQEEQIATLASDLDRSEETVRQLESQVEKKATALSRAEAEAQQAEARARQATKQSGTESPAVSLSGDSMLPPMAQPGECYARVFVAPTYETTTEKVLKRDASERIEIIPAQYGTAQEEVLVKDATVRLEPVPATHKHVEEKILLKPASTKVVEVPAVYETQSEEVLVKPAHTIWKKGRGPVEKINESTGEIMCLVEVPAEYRTVTKRVLKSPATTRVEEIPAQYKTVKRQVVDAPATVREVKIPAEYETIQVQTLVSPPKENRVTLPAEYQTVESRHLMTDGKMAWRPVLCETNMTRDVVRDIQKSLLDAGHDPGPIDGYIGPLTMSGVRSYQASKGLDRGGLTLATLNSLGVATETGTLTARRP